MAFHAMLTSLAQKHNIAHLLVPVDRRVVSAAVATELSENPAAAIEHTSTKLGGTIPFTAQMDHAVKATLKAPMRLTLLRHTDTRHSEAAPSTSFFCFIMQMCYATGILGPHYLQDSILDAFAVSVAQVSPLHQCHLCWALRTCYFLLHSLALRAHAVQSLDLLIF